MALPEKQTLKEKLRQTEDEYEYNGNIASLGAHKSSPTQVTVKHAVVQQSSRRNGYGTRLFESLFEVLREDGIRYIIVEIQAMENGDKSDPVMNFLQQFGLSHNESFEHYNWGTCIRASGPV